MRALKQVSNMQYNTINYSHHAVHYIPMTYLFYNWNVFPSDLLHPFHPLLQPNFKLTIVQINKYLKKKKKGKETNNSACRHILCWLQNEGCWKVAVAAKVFPDFWSNQLKCIHHSGVKLRKCTQTIGNLQSHTQSCKPGCSNKLDERICLQYFAKCTI